jgi:hypothetical protein
MRNKKQTWVTSGSFKTIAVLVVQPQARLHSKKLTSHCLAINVFCVAL